MSGSPSVWILGLIILAAGAVGGVIHSLIPDSSGYKNTWWDWIKNILLGAAAAILSWGLYGPFAKMAFNSTSSWDALVISQVFAAVLIGISGARWLSKEAQNADFKKLISANASESKGLTSSVRAKYENLIP